MALPTMRGYWPSHRNRYEQALVRSRQSELDLRNQWSQTADYFRRSDLWAAKQNGWSSEQAFQESMDAYKVSVDKDVKESNLKKRQDKLATLLAQENMNYEAELKGLNRSNSDRLDEMRSRTGALKSAREEARQKCVEEKLYQRWRENNHDMKQVEAELLKEHVVSSWGDQLQEQELRLEAARQEEKAFEKQMEEDRLAGMKADELREAERLEEEKSVKATLKQQMMELKTREAQARELLRQEEDLLRHQWELEYIVDRQRQQEEMNKRNSLGRALLRQHKAQMMNRSRIIQDELEQDKEMLESLMREESEQVALQTARREKSRADARWMKQVLDDQLRLEKVREAELDMLYQDEAARIWHKREDEWNREREARQRLMAEVLESRQEQISEKLSSLRKQQEESLQQREDLVREMELVQQLTTRKMEEEKRSKMTSRSQLDQQMKNLREQHQQQKREQEELIEEEKQEEAGYDDLLQQETQRLRLQGYTPRNHGRSRQAWN